MAHGFFSYVSNTWNNSTYSSTRTTYKQLTPFSTAYYFDPLKSIQGATYLAASIIHSPLWLAVNTVLQLVKAVVNLVATALLLPITLATLIVAPKSERCADLKSVFQFTAANTLVASTMACLAALATCASLFLKPLQVATNLFATATDQGKNILNSCNP